MLDNSPHLLDLTKSILDPIHGLIRFTDSELRVINHPLYQRLRKIKQNGLLHLTFPSATHTRFEHSLGVLFVADSMLRSLLFNSVSATSKKSQTVTTPGKAQVGQAINLNTVNRSILKELFRTTRLAALAHDLGHGPLSHTFDNFAPRFQNTLKLLDNKKLQAIRDFRSAFTEYAREHNDGKTPYRAPHELMSCIFFASIWHAIDSRDQLTPRIVAAAIIGKPAFDLIEKPLRPWVPLIHDLVASAPADADRMDYMERDSRSCGVTYGLFDRNRLLKTMLCYKSSRNKKAEFRLGLKASGFRAVENFIQARFELFVQVYYHKTNRAVELMLQAISNTAGTTQNIVADTSLDALIQDYVSLGDDSFLDILRGEQSSVSKVDNTQINMLATQIHERKLWKRVVDFQELKALDNPPGRDEVPSDSGMSARQKLFFETLQSKFSKTVFCLDRIKPKATKELDIGAAILSQGSTGIYAAASGMTWGSVSPIINVLGNEEKQIQRIYIQTSNPTEATAVKSMARTLVADCTGDGAHADQS